MANQLMYQLLRDSAAVLEQSPMTKMTPVSHRATVAGSAPDQMGPVAQGWCAVLDPYLYLA